MWFADMENPRQHQKKEWMKELLQQTVENELIHCEKLLGKTKHIQKTNKKTKKLTPGPNLEILDSVQY